MDILNIEGSDDTPKVRLDKNAKVFEISGRSLPEDSLSFYNPVMDWIKEYGKDPNPTTEFTFKLDYFNTASSKMILDLLKLLNGIKGVTILWYCLSDDEEVKEAGEEFSEQVDIPFIFRSY
jgi:hypothetical protein